MSIKSKQRNEKRPNPNYRNDLQAGPNKYYIRQKPLMISELPSVKTKGAFGNSRVNRKPEVPETVSAQEVTTATV
jgi:hypothetical protein